MIHVAPCIQQQSSAVVTRSSFAHAEFTSIWQGVNKKTRYIDYAHVINVTKYKIYKIRKSLESSVNPLAQHAHGSYSCDICGHIYGPLDVLSLELSAEGVFCCEFCPGRELTVEAPGGAPELSEGAERLAKV